MPFVAGNKTPRETGIRSLKKMAEQQADYGEKRMAPTSNKTRHAKNTKQKTTGLAESPTAPIRPL